MGCHPPLPLPPAFLRTWHRQPGEGKAQEVAEEEEEEEKEEEELEEKKEEEDRRPPRLRQDPPPPTFKIFFLRSAV